MFRLGNRGAKPRATPGGLAAARFEIVKDKIVSWAQVPVPKGGDDASGRLTHDSEEGEGRPPDARGYGAARSELFGTIIVEIVGFPATTL